MTEPTRPFMAPMDAATALKDGNYAADQYDGIGHVWFPCPIPMWRAVAAAALAEQQLAAERTSHAAEIAVMREACAELVIYWFADRGEECARQIRALPSPPTGEQKP